MERLAGREGGELVGSCCPSIHPRERSCQSALLSRGWACAALGQEGACWDEMAACCRMTSDLSVPFNGFLVPFLVCGVDAWC